MKSKTSTPAHLLGCLALLLIPLFARAGEKPNILWITTEDISCELGCYGDAYADTPNLDALADRGIRYTRFFAESPMCAPSRATIITGMHNGPLGGSQMRSMHRVPESVRPFTAWLREAGYYCTNNSKTDYNLARDASGENQEFINEGWDQSGGQAHWRNRPEGAPFFAIFNYVNTHQSRASRDDYADFVDRVQSKLAPEQIHDPAKAPLPPHYPDSEISRKTVARYHDCITSLDNYVASLLGDLEKDGLAEDTIVFFYSDHGAGMPTGKACPSYYGLRCPLIVHIPEKFRNLAPREPVSVSERLTCFADLAPTVLNLAGIAPPEYMHGQAFLGENVADAPEYVLGSRDRMDETLETTRWISDGRFLLVRSYQRNVPADQQSLTSYYNGNGELCQEIRALKAAGKLTAAQKTYWSDTREGIRFFDCDADPWNLNNLAKDPRHGGRVKEMETALETFLLAERDLGFWPEPELEDAEKSAAAHDLARQPDKYPLERILETARSEDSALLTERLSDKDFAVRYWAVTGLAALGDEAKPALPKLTALIGDEAASVRIAAAALVADLDDSPEALDCLASELRGSNQWAACRAARQLELLGERARPKMDDMLTAFRERVVLAADQKKPMDIHDYGFRFSLITALTKLGHNPETEVLPLYPRGAVLNSLPHKEEETVEIRDGIFSGFKGATHPTLEVFLPEKAEGPTPAVVICPGGGYIRQVYRKEGTDIARVYNEQGIAAFVLKYRVPNDATMKDKAIGSLQDAQRSIQLVRENAAKWNVDPSKVGIMGFSAGGHVASTAGTHFKKDYIPNPEGTSLRPDFVILVYPVISMIDGITHVGSKANLLGPNPDEEMVQLFSNELQIDGDTPPTWLTHAGDDAAVPVANSVRFYNALIENGVPAEMHLYPEGGHGFVLKNPAEVWMASIFDWMKRSHIQ